MPNERLTRAAVTTGRRTVEFCELPVPDLGEGDGLLAVEAVGICGSDVVSFDRADEPVRVMGHETVGRIAEATPSAMSRWGARPGDRVLLEEYLPCGHCRFCRSAEFRFCLESDPAATPGALRYGTTGLAVAPGLWGGFSELQYLHPRTVLHHVPESLPADVATMALPVANGYEWAYRSGGVGPGSAVVVIGPGQQGLGCVLAARIAGASVIVAVGLERDGARLAAAKSLGATHTIVSGPDLVEQVLAATGGEGADVVVNTASGKSAVFNDAVAMLRKSGRLVLPVREKLRQDGVDLGAVGRKCLIVIGMRGHSFAAVESAIAILQDNLELVRPLATMTVPLERVADAILSTGGTGPIPDVIHATVAVAPADQSTSEA
ncbi:zinc-dependent alcohol dehydrogenase [Labedaea rhizosphaerae]|uniref:Threonine dehydrogenase-like Zn-dependent dehydrogenase n=1 Tax=Labedaea rhizosphaerae TaxID=598644 RepID=A0A4R6S568_LABRH|nr:alcohol dehydrogenase catalytic domain-containing protein [Labedaea rhizosphaerae]TDP94801.1 threonine dehydrogenase-like Zn-dependent dehydrogenase [Labedaea rhizosphaerae]